MSETRLRRVPAVLWRSVGAEVILADSSRTEFELLSGSGGAVWRALREPLTFRELVDNLAEEHEVEPGSIEEDIRQLVSTLSARGLVEGETVDG